MDHSPFFRDCPNSETGILLIHGILSSPRHFDFLIPHIPAEYKVSSILLSGHGGTIRDFSKASMRQWQAQVQQEIQNLNTPNVIIIGHSLGALLALQAATAHQCIRGLFLLNIPLLPQLRPAAIGRSLRIAFGKARTNDPIDMACYQDLSIQVEPYPWKYLGWIPNFISLLCLAQRCRKLPKTLKIPCKAYLGTKDELVRMRSRRYLDQNPIISLKILENGIHYGYCDQHQQIISADLKSFLLNEF